MARKTYRSKKDSKQKRILIIIGVLAVLFGFTALLISLDSVDQSSEALKKRNLQLITEAREKLDVSICDQINGGLLGEEATPSRYVNGAVFEGGPGVPAKNEAQTKDQCRKSVAGAIERQRQLDEKRKR